MKVHHQTSEHGLNRLVQVILHLGPGPTNTKTCAEIDRNENPPTNIYMY